MVKPAKTVALPSKGHVPPVEEIPLPARAQVCIEDEAGVTAGGVPIGTGEYVLERAIEVLEDGGAGRLTCCPTNMLDNQAAAFIAIECLEQRPS